MTIVKTENTRTQKRRGGSGDGCMAILDYLTSNKAKHEQNLMNIQAARKTYNETEKKKLIWEDEIYRNEKTAEADN